MDDDFPDFSEFTGAKVIKKFHRYMITEEHIGFGLLDLNDDLHRFVTDPFIASSIAEEINDVARRWRHAIRGEAEATFAPFNSRVELPRRHDGMLAPFVGPGLKLNRAWALLDQLADILERFAREAKFEAVKIGEFDGRSNFRLTLTQKPAASIPLLIGDIIHNGRSALDILVNDIAYARQVSGPKRLAFPFAKDAKELAKIIDRTIKPLGADVAAAITQLKPYTGGNADLVGLHELNIIDKHRMVVPAFVSVFRAWDYEGHINALRAKDGQPPITIAFLGDGNLTPFFDGQVVSCDPGATPFDNYKDDGAGIRAQFPRQETPFRDAPIVETLTRLLNVVASIGRDFSVRFAPPSP